MSTKKNPFLASDLPVGLTDAALRTLGPGQFINRSLEEYLALLLVNAANPDGGSFQSVQVTPVLDTSAYTAGDVLFATTAVPATFRSAGASALLRSVALLDKDDQTAAGIDLVFLSGNVALGTINAAPSITDANAAKILGIVSIASGDFIDVGGAKLATKLNVGLTLSPDSGTTLYVAAIARGTPTQSASGIVLTLGLEQE